MATPVVEYNISTAAIAELKSKYGQLKADTPQGYEDVKTALKEVSGYRIAVEKTRKELKADALEYGRKVDAEAKRIQALIAEVEDPLKAEKKKVDDEKDRIAREKAEAERRELERLRAEEEARKRAAEEAERERVRKEQEAENARLAAEREKLEAERREQEAKLAAERKAMEEAQAKIRAEQEKLERERIEREAKERAEREARERIEREKREAEEAARKQEELRKLRAAQAPDKQKLAAFAKALQEVEAPHMMTEWGSERLMEALDALDSICHSLESANPIISDPVGAR